MGTMEKIGSGRFDSAVRPGILTEDATDRRFVVALPA
jgi:hypothetical protein